MTSYCFEDSESYKKYKQFDNNIDLFQIIVHVFNSNLGYTDRNNIVIVNRVIIINYKV